MVSKHLPFETLSILSNNGKTVEILHRILVNIGEYNLAFRLKKFFITNSTQKEI